MRLIDAEPIEKALFRQADKALAKNPYANARVCAFRRAFELILDAPTIAAPPNDAPPNDPLTLEELREMDGEPVWVIFYAAYGETVGMWVLVSVDEYTKEVFLTNRLGGRSEYKEAAVDIEAIYRRKPEKGTP